MALKTFIEAIRDTMAEEMRRDSSIILLGEDVGKKGGVFLATDGLWAEFGDDRVIDTPLSESMIIGTSIGAAMNGLRPIAEIQFADFIHPAFNQLVSEAARMRYRSNNGFGVPMTVRAPYGGGVHGALYHSQSVEAFFAHVPGLKVVIPSTPVRRRRPAALVDPRRRPGALLRAQEDVPVRARRRARDRLRGAARQGGDHAPGHADDGARLRPDGALRARGGRRRGGGRDQRRGRRPSDAAPARQGDGPVVGEEDRQVPRSSTRTTGSWATAPSSPRSSPRRRSTTSTDRSRGSPARTCRAFPTTTSSRTGSWSTRRRSRTGSASSPRTDGRASEDELNAVEAELRAILVPYEDVLEAAEIYGMEVLRRPGAKAHDWFAGVQQVNGAVKFNFLPMHAHPELLERLLGGAPEAPDRCVGLQVHIARRRAHRGPRGARRPRLRDVHG